MATDLQTDTAHAARVYDYLLGGKDNFAPDREAGEKLRTAFPDIVTAMRANRRFMVRAAHFLAERGFRQFLDIGTGLPTPPNLHEVVQAVDPTCSVVYADNDPLVLVHARALLVSTPEGQTEYIDGDLRKPAELLSTPPLSILDLSQPVAVTMIGILHLVTDDEARTAIDTLMGRLSSGSALALTAVASDIMPVDAAIAAVQQSGIPFKKARTRTEAQALFSGLELIEPGVVQIHRWHPEVQTAWTVRHVEEDEARPEAPTRPPSQDELTAQDRQVTLYGAVAFKS
jgi:hypothetical protein